MSSNRSIFFTGSREHVEGGEVTYGDNNDIIIVITNSLLEAELRDCLDKNAYTTLRFTYAEIEETVPDTTHWVVFHYDMSEVAIFTNELDACRYAWRNMMRVAPYIPGEGVRETINRPGV